MDPCAIERNLPTFAPPARRILLAIRAIVRRVSGLTRRVRGRFVVRLSLRAMIVLVLVFGSGLGWIARRARSSGMRWPRPNESVVVPGTTGNGSRAGSTRTIAGCGPPSKRRVNT